MSLIHKLVLYGLLGFLSASLIIPGFMVMFDQDIGSTDLLAKTRDGKNQLRALYGMMAGIGLMALWACRDLQQSRSLVIALGIIMALLVVARSYSIIVDGAPKLMTQLYLTVELLMAAVFLLWPPTEPI